MIDAPSEALDELADPDDRETPALLRSERRLAVTRELAEIGLDLARALRAEVMARVSGVAGAEGETRAPVFSGDVGLIYSRIARAVRMTLALEAAIEGDVQVQAQRVASDRRFRQLMAEGDEAQRKADAAKDKVRAAVRWAIETEGGERAETERLYRELEEVLEDETDLEMMAGMTYGEVIAYVCRELGVPFDADLWFDPPDEAEGEAVEPPDRVDRPDALDAVLDQANRGDEPRGKPRPP